jgi:preprotein translocase subunit SecG
MQHFHFADNDFMAVSSCFMLFFSKYAVILISQFFLKTLIMCVIGQKVGKDHQILHLNSYPM